MANDSEILASGEKTSQQTQKYFPSGEDKEIEKGDFCALTLTAIYKIFQTILNEIPIERKKRLQDLCIFRREKLPFFTGMGVLAKRRTRTGQRSRTKGQSGEGGQLSIYGIHAPTMLSSNTINSRLHGSQPGFLFG